MTIESHGIDLWGLWETHGLRSKSVKNSIKIGEATIGEDSPCFIVAEIGQAHDGSLGMAHAYIDAVAKTGADAIKFQTHIADAESTPDDKFRVNVFPQDETRLDYWRRMEFSESQWHALAKHAAEKNLTFFSTPFSMEAVDLLEGLGMAAWKVGSGETENHPMLERMAKTGKPVLISTGMSSWSQIDEAVSVVQRDNDQIAIFQCTTSYPCPPENIGLNVLDLLRERYDYPVGLSDHSGTIFPSVAAASMGIDLIEIHTVFSKECFGPDVMASVTTQELATLVDGVRFIETAKQNPIDKDEHAKQMSELSVLFGKSLYINGKLPAGHVLSTEDIALKKPGTGIAAKNLNQILGRKLKRDYDANEQLKEMDIE